MSNDVPDLPPVFSALEMIEDLRCAVDRHHVAALVRELSRALRKSSSQEVDSILVIEAIWQSAICKYPHVIDIVLPVCEIFRHLALLPNVRIFLIETAEDKTISKIRSIYFEMRLLEDQQPSSREDSFLLKSSFKKDTSLLISGLFHSSMPLALHCLRQAPYISVLTRFAGGILAMPQQQSGDSRLLTEVMAFLANLCSSSAQCDLGVWTALDFHARDLATRALKAFPDDPVMSEQCHRVLKLTGMAMRSHGPTRSVLD